MDSIEKNVLYADDWIIVFNKPASLASIPDLSKEDSALDLLSRAYKKQLYPINRIDRPTSGILLFSKSKSAASKLTQQFKNRTIKKEYLAFVTGKMDQQSGVMSDHLVKSSKHKKAYIDSEDNEKAKKAHTEYEVLGSSDNYTLVKLIPKTGRFHQLRAQLSSRGNAIKGDVKYGFRRANKDRSIHLHAWKLTFVHPKTKEKLELIAPLSEEPLWKFGQSLIEFEKN